MQHWQYNVIITQATGVIKYSVSNSVEEKGTIVNRKKLLVHVLSLCEELVIIHEESRSSTNKHFLWIYHAVLYILMINLLRSEVLECVHVITHRVLAPSHHDLYKHT